MAVIHYNHEALSTKLNIWDPKIDFYTYICIRRIFHTHFIVVIIAVTIFADFLTFNGFRKLSF
jgi:hypothetical protein